MKYKVVYYNATRSDDGSLSSDFNAQCVYESDDKVAAVVQCVNFHKMTLSVGHVVEVREYLDQSSAQALGYSFTTVLSFVAADDFSFELACRQDSSD